MVKLDFHNYYLYPDYTNFASYLIIIYFHCSFHWIDTRWSTFLEYADEATIQIVPRVMNEVLCYHLHAIFMGWDIVERPSQKSMLFLSYSALSLAISVTRPGDFLPFWWNVFEGLFSMSKNWWNLKSIWAILLGLKKKINLLWQTFVLLGKFSLL